MLFLVISIILELQHIISIWFMARFLNLFMACHLSNHFKLLFMYEYVFGEISFFPLENC